MAGGRPASLQRALAIEGTDDVLASEPNPFGQLEAAVASSSPVLTGPVGVRHRLDLGRRLVIAEVSRLAPRVSFGGGLFLEVQIVDPQSGKLADFDPFVDATPASLALGAVARDGGGGGSVLDRARQHLGDVVGGLVAVSIQVAHFIVTNPVVRSIVGIVAVVLVASVCAPTGFALCVAAAGAVSVLGIGTGAVDLIRSGATIVRSCPAGKFAACASGVARAALAALELAYALPIGVGVWRVARAEAAVLRARDTSRYAKALGDFGEELSALSRVVRGGRVVGRQEKVCLGTMTSGCPYPDLTVRRLKDRLLRTGEQTYVESKYGPGAQFTPAQLRVYPCLGARLIVDHWNPGGSTRLSTDGSTCSL